MKRCEGIMKFNRKVMAALAILVSFAVLFPAATASCMGTISFSSDPSYAQIYIDGELMGTTSGQYKTEIKGVACGDRLIELKLDGYETYTKEIKVEGGTGYGVSAKMVPLPEETVTVAEPGMVGTMIPATPAPQVPEAQSTPGLFVVTVIAGIILCMAVFCRGR